MKPFSLCIATSVGLLTTTAADAAVVTFGGNVFNEQVTEWRTDATLKTVDLDGDNVYGTAGYLMMATAENGQGNFIQDAAVSGNNAFTYDNGGLETLNNLPTGVTVDSGFLPINRLVSGDFYPLIDNPNGGADLRIGHALHDQFNNSNDAINGTLATLTIGSDTDGVDNPDAVIRIGVMLNNDPGITVSDFVRVQSTTSNTGPVENFGGDFGQTLMFFDITDYTAGDTIEIWPYGRVDDGRTSVAFSGLTFDVLVPEPGSLTLLGVATLLATRRRRLA